MRYYQTVPFPVGPVTVMEEGGEIVFIGFSAAHWRCRKKGNARHQGSFSPVIGLFRWRAEDIRFTPEVVRNAIPAQDLGSPSNHSLWQDMLIR